MTNVFLQIIRDRNWIPNGEDEVKVLDELMMKQIRFLFKFTNCGGIGAMSTITDKSIRLSLSIDLPLFALA